MNVYCKVHDKLKCLINTRTNVSRAFKQSLLENLASAFVIFELSVETVCGQFPDSTVPRRKLPRWTYPRTDNSPTGHFPHHMF